MGTPTMSVDKERGYIHTHNSVRTGTKLQEKFNPRPNRAYKVFFFAISAKYVPICVNYTENSILYEAKGTSIDFLFKIFFN
jgi:hypothetical protein